jgi:hypothetical protein
LTFRLSVMLPMLSPLFSPAPRRPVPCARGEPEKVDKSRHLQGTPVKTNAGARSEQRFTADRSALYFQRERAAEKLGRSHSGSAVLRDERPNCRRSAGIGTVWSMLSTSENVDGPDFNRHRCWRAHREFHCTAMVTAELLIQAATICNVAIPFGVSGGTRKLT